MQDRPLVSLVTPSYNQGRFLRRTMDSILGQSYPHIEYLVMDGGSTDESVAILRKNVVVLWAPSGLPAKGSKKKQLAGATT